jgi:hypothetical protein
MQVAQMKLATTKAMIPVAALVAALAGCGGGDDAEAGAPTGLSIVPTTLTETAVAEALGGPVTGACAGGPAGQVYIYGGAGPYRIDNPNPTLISVDKTTVDGPGGSFNVSIAPACFTTLPIVIIDKLNRQVIFTISNKPATATTATP